MSKLDIILDRLNDVLTHQIELDDKIEQALFKRGTYACTKQTARPAFQDSMPVERDFKEVTEDTSQFGIPQTQKEFEDRCADFQLRTPCGGNCECNDCIVRGLIRRGQL